MPDKFLEALLKLEPTLALMLASVFADIVCLGSCAILFLVPGVMDQGMWNTLFLGVVTSTPVLAIYTIIAFGFINREIERSRASNRGQELQATLITAAVVHVIAVVTSIAAALAIRLSFLFSGSGRAAVPHLCYFVFLMAAFAAALLGWEIKGRWGKSVVILCVCALTGGYVVLVSSHAKMLSASLPWAS